jgi:hypothetical protein
MQWKIESEDFFPSYIPTIGVWINRINPMTEDGATEIVVENFAIEDPFLYLWRGT